MSIWLFRTSSDVAQACATRHGRLISDNHGYEKEMIKPDEMRDVKLLGGVIFRLVKLYRKT